MISFLFWNLKRKPLLEFISNLASRYEIDVILLAECTIAPSVLLKVLNRDGVAVYHYAPGYVSGKIEIFTRFSDKFLQPIYDEDRLTIRHLKLPGLTDFLLAATHVSSKRHWRDDSQSGATFELANSIRLAEDAIGHSRTILVGDLNMNPFETGMVIAQGLHSVMSRQIAERGTRTVSSKRYPFFYNPMWNLLGDATPGPPGTYYLNNAEPKLYFWNIFDQVLIRPELLSAFSNDDLEILTSDGETSFLSPNGLPNIQISSDHLPIFFKLSL